MDFHQIQRVQNQLLVFVLSNDITHEQCASLKKSYSLFIKLSTLDLDDHYLADGMALQNSPSWSVWNARIVDDFLISLLVIPVLQQAPHSHEL